MASRDLTQAVSGVRDTMRVFTYASGSEDLPLNERAIARIKCPMDCGFGKTRAVRLQWHPVIFCAATQAEAGEKAAAWWDAEVERERAKVAASEKRVAAMKARRDAIADTTEQSDQTREDQ